MVMKVGKKYEVRFHKSDLKIILIIAFVLALILLLLNLSDSKGVIKQQGNEINRLKQLSYTNTDLKYTTADIASVKKELDDKTSEYESLKSAVINEHISELDSGKCGKTPKFDSNMTAEEENTFKKWSSCFNSAQDRLIDKFLLKFGD